MFQGASKLSLDNRGRMVVPTKHRDALMVESEGKLTLTRSPDQCLLLLPRPFWERKRVELVQLGAQQQAIKRLYLGSASDVEMDNAGRVLLSPELREAGQMAADAKVMLVGMGSYFEVWEASAYEKNLAAIVAAGIPPTLEFSF